jgi:uncharacterized protein (TIGR02444 family)
MADFPAHPFWNYSLALYPKPGVNAACLTLQDEFDLDVNLVLFCLWAGAEGPGELTGSELGECVARGAQWQREVVQRLRYIRRTLKRDNLGATAELTGLLRPQAQSLELMAEHVEQLFLAGIVPAVRGETGAEAALKNLRAYFELAGVAVGNSAQAELRVILKNAWPDRDWSDSESVWR